MPDVNLLSKLRKHVATMSSAQYLPERVSLLYRLSGTDVPIIVGAAGVTAFALWGYVSAGLIVAWFIWLGVASTVRYLLAQAYRRAHPAAEQAEQWENYFCVVSALLGGSWGLALLFINVKLDSLQEITFTFLISSIAMGLPPSLAPSPKAFVSFILPILAPVVAMLFSLGGTTNASTGLLLLVFASVLLGLYLSNYSALMETLSYGQENALLLKELQKAKERLDLAVQSSAVTVWEWDARRGSIYLDAAWSAMTGGEAKESFVAIEQLEKVVHPGDLPRLQEALGECLKGLRGEYIAEHRVRVGADNDGDSNWIWILSRGRVVERSGDGQALRMAGTNVDITQRKRAEVELLNALQREKELSELKSKFVSMASHEFRTPLATILSAAELLEFYPDSLSPEDKLKMLHGIQSGAKRMNMLIEDVLTIGKAEAGVLQYRPGPVDLKDLCRRVVEDMRIGEAKERVIEFEQSFEHGNMNLDERLLRHILSNLLSNALKYSPVESPVTMLLTERQGHALIEVGDQGIGIPLQDQARLFESFHRASNVGNRPGTGLGLAIVKKAVELHGGTISIDSEVGKGTRIKVLLPLAVETTRAG